jgi:hypothetical protein
MHNIILDDWMSSALFLVFASMFYALSARRWNGYMAVIWCVEGLCHKRAPVIAWTVWIIGLLYIPVAVSPVAPPKFRWFSVGANCLLKLVWTTTAKPCLEDIKLDRCKEIVHELRSPKSANPISRWPRQWETADCRLFPVFLCPRLLFSADNWSERAP